MDEKIVVPISLMDENSCSMSSSDDVRMMHARGKGGKDVMLGEH
jgi:hypothetical protein